MCRSSPAVNALCHNVLQSIDYFIMDYNRCKSAAKKNAHYSYYMMMGILNCPVLPEVMLSLETHKTNFLCCPSANHLLCNMIRNKFPEKLCAKLHLR